VWACVIAADASIPDNPSGPNQSSTADKANLSNPSCDGVVLDRTPPTVAIGASSSSVGAGDLVSFQASASDATSGLTGTRRWTWGDNTGGGSGDAVTHTYTQPGTYEVALTVADSWTSMPRGELPARRRAGPRTARPSDGRFHGDRPARTFKVR
jgi:plastocyanin